MVENFNTFNSVLAYCHNSNNKVRAQILLDLMA